jgi:Gly-Xaa carboxypeptidase
MAQSKPPSSEPHSIPLLQDDEEQHLDPLYTPSPPPKRAFFTRYSWIVALLLVLLFIGLLAVPKPHPGSSEEDDYDDNAPVPDSKEICTQSGIIDIPDNKIYDALQSVLESPRYRQESVQRLSGAVQIATESFDDMGEVGQDPRWDVFQKFHDYLEDTFPLV